MLKKRYIGVAEVLQGMGLSEQYSVIAEAFYVVFDTDIITKERGWNFWAREAFVGHPQLGDVLIVSSDETGMNYACPFQDTDDGITFSEKTTWTLVVRAWIIPPGTVAAAESAQPGEVDTAPPLQDPNEHLMQERGSGRALRLVESEDEAPGGPLIMEAIVIEPGWGNIRHNNYYPRDMLEKCAGVFKGVKMYATDHREDERSVLTEVSQILECPVSFTETGAPVARIAIFDETFATNVRNRAAAGEQEGVDLLKDLHLSILAEGLAQEKPYVEGDRVGNYVTEITESYAVDWVTRAGAGGHATRLMESANPPAGEPSAKPPEANTPVGETEDDPEGDPEDQAPANIAEAGKQVQVDISENTDSPGTADTPVERDEGDTPPETALDRPAIDAILSESNLPESVRSLLTEQVWPSKESLLSKVAVVKEQWKKEVGSGKVYGMGTTEVPSEPTDPPPPIEERERFITNKYLGPNTRAGGENDG